MSCDLNPTADQRQIHDAAQAMLAAAYPLARLQHGAPDDLGEIAAFGSFAMTLPADRGGPGFSAVEEALLHRLFGQALVWTRVLATALATRLMPDLTADSPLVTGAAFACPALSYRGGLMMIDGAGADYALVFDGPALALVALDGVAQAPTAGLGHDLAVSRADGPPPLARRDDPAMQTLTRLLIAAQRLGAAEATRDLAVSYAGVREQFGRPIGTFQAIKHRCADMALAAERVSAQLVMAAIALRDGRSDAPFQAAAIDRLAARAALDSARACVQIHGGIGFSAEGPAHHFVKRAHLLRQLGPAPDLLTLPAALAPRRPIGSSA